MPWGSSLFPLLIVSSSGKFTGLFVYSPGPGAGKLIASITAQAGTDPFGNAFLGGNTTYVQYPSGTWVAFQQAPGGSAWWFAASEAGPWTEFASEIMTFNGSSGAPAIALFPSMGFMNNVGGLGNFIEIWVGPSGDVTGAKDSNLISALYASGCSTVHLLPGTFYINAPVQLATAQMLAGAGSDLTTIQAVTGFTGPMIELASTAAANVTVRDVFLNANSVAGVTAGVLLDNTAAAGVQDHLLDNVLVRNCSGDGYKFLVCRDTKIRSCRSESVLGFGFNITSTATDMQFVNCTSGTSLNHGFNIAGVNNLFTNCKAYFAGNNYTNGLWTGSSVHGFYCNAFFNAITGCSAQQNAVHGFYLDGTTGSFAYGCTLTGCEADTNSAAVANVGSGIFVNGINFAGRSTVVSGNSGQNNAGLGLGSQLYGIQIQGANPDVMLIGNTVAGSSGYFNAVAGASGYYRIDPTYGIWQTVTMSAGWTASSPVPSIKPLIGFMAQTTGLATHAAFSGNSNIGTVPAQFIPATFQEITGFNQASVPVQIGIANVTGVISVIGAPAGTTEIGWNGAYPLDL